jgi:hypothetical protein
MIVLHQKNACTIRSAWQLYPTFLHGTVPQSWRCLEPNGSAKFTRWAQKTRIAQRSAVREVSNHVLPFQAQTLRHILRFSSVRS